MPKPGLRQGPAAWLGILPLLVDPYRPMSNEIRLYRDLCAT